MYIGYMYVYRLHVLVRNTFTLPVKKCNYSAEWLMVIFAHTLYMYMNIILLYMQLSHTHTHTHTHSYIHIQYTYIYTHTHTHMHTHTHTHSLTAPQVLRPDPTVLSSIVRDHIHGSYIAVVEQVAMVIDDGAPSQHAEVSLGACPNHLTVQGHIFTSTVEGTDKGVGGGRGEGEGGRGEGEGGRGEGGLEKQFHIYLHCIPN